MIKSVFKYINNDSYEINITDHKVHILNYIKILDLSYKEISILVINKIINISGDDLSIRKLDDKELYIVGNIKGIGFIDEG